MSRPSTYFTDKKAGSFTYPINNRFHHTSAVLNPKVWTDSEKKTLAKHARIQYDDKRWENIANHIATKSPMECYIQYNNVSSPNINNAEWSTEEDAKLIDLANKHEEHNWCVIAEELGTNRTPFACIQHYQQNLNKKMINTNDWSVEEDQLLKNAVNEYGKGKWQQISGLIPNRTSAQCLNRWKKSPVCNEDIVSGKWIPAEERLLYLAAIAYGAPKQADSKKSSEELDILLSLASPSSDALDTSLKESIISSILADPTPVSFTRWKDVAALVPGKSEIQCREKWTSSLDPSVNAAAYTAQEDAHLLQIVQVLKSLRSPTTSSSNTTIVHSTELEEENTGISADSVRSIPAGTSVCTAPAGTNVRTAPAGTISWSRVALYMPGRTDASLRSRWNLLMKQENDKRKKEKKRKHTAEQDEEPDI